MIKKPKIATIIGTRPQFIKHAAIETELKKYFNQVSIHSGQHYDAEMSDVFFNELGLDMPKYNLKINANQHGEQTAQMLSAIEKILIKEKPNMVVVYGDTNTTLAGALAASKLMIPIAHIEAGMRSFNREMPEEINRVLTDHISNLLFTSSGLASENLNKEGISRGVVLSGDLMKDLIFIMKAKSLIKKNDDHSNKIYCTIHRPYNTDNPERLAYVLENLNQLNAKVVFSLHPRTKKMMSQFNFPKKKYSNIKFIKPQSYINNLNNINNFDSLITDSGGMQKEAYFLKKRCITLRTETEWIETLNHNWNTLLFDNLNDLNAILEKELGDWDESLYGDNQAGKIIVNEIRKYLN